MIAPALWTIGASLIAGAVVGATAPLVIVLSALTDADHGSLLSVIVAALIFGAVGVFIGLFFGGFLGVVFAALFTPLQMLVKKKPSLRILTCIVAAVAAGLLASLLTCAIFASSGGSYTHGWVPAVLALIALVFSGVSQLLAQLRITRPKL